MGCFIFFKYSILLFPEYLKLGNVSPDTEGAVGALQEQKLFQTLGSCLNPCRSKKSPLAYSC